MPISAWMARGTRIEDNPRGVRVFRLREWMRDPDCVDFLRWALPRLRLRWTGFRRVRRQVCKRLERRLRLLGISDLRAYQSVLESTPEEWKTLEALCRVTISRFYRDRHLFDLLRDTIIPDLVRRSGRRGNETLHCWCAGSASGEEPYTLSLLWHFALRSHFPDCAFRIVATEVDEGLLERARAGCYPPSSLRDLPASWRTEGFTKAGDRYRIKPPFAGPVDFRQMDLRQRCPSKRFHLILCRNLAFTYFEESLQQEVLHRLVGKMITGGILAIGTHETLPRGDVGLRPCAPGDTVFRLEP